MVTGEVSEVAGYKRKSRRDDWSNQSDTWTDQRRKGSAHCSARRRPLWTIHVSGEEFICHNTAAVVVNFTVTYL